MVFVGVCTVATCAANSNVIEGDRPAAVHGLTTNGDVVDGDNERAFRGFGFSGIVVYSCSSTFDTLRSLYLFD